MGNTGNSTMLLTKRRWLKFSLRGLLAVVAIFGIWLGIKINACARQAEEVAAILAAGGGVDF